MKLYDFENHIYDLATIDAMAARKEYPIFDKVTKEWKWGDNVVMDFSYLYGKLTDIDAGRLADMDRVGITTALISSSPGFEDLDPSDSIALCEKCNNSIYGMTQNHPDRFLGTAVLPVYDTNAAIKELERCVNELGFVCWHTHSNYGKTSVHDERFIPIWEAATDLGVFIYLHPTVPAFNAIAGIADFGYTLSGPGMGFTIDTMLTTLKIICNGVFDKVPKARMVLGHFGEALPFLLDRIDNRLAFLPNPLIKSEKNPSDYFRDNIWVTTSGNMSPEAYRCTRDVLGAEKIIYGSDFPYESIDDMTNFIKNLDQTDEEREMLFFKNAETLLGK